MPTLLTINASYQGGLHFVASDQQGHQVSIDSGPADTKTAGPTPMESVLQAAAACSAMDVVTILQKRHKEITSFEVEAQGAKRDQFPRVFTAIHLTYKVRGPNLNQEEVEKAVKLSQETYCSVVNMMKPKVEVSWVVDVQQG